MKENIFKISGIEDGSIAQELGLEAGDYLLSINGEKLCDVFDYRLLIANEELLLEIKKGDGEIWELEIEKDEYEDLGLEFETSLMDEARNCTNNCIFCFIDQLPAGMRETLYFKDDDSRLSFLTGNYVTLTNMHEDDIDRIIKYRMSPINVSVHTTNQDLRIFMLKNRFAGNVLNYLQRIIDSGIMVNCQIVLCPGINDGKELDRTINDLVSLEKINSISVVPVGITKYRQGLPELKPFEPESSLKVIRQIEEWQNKLLARYKSRIIYPADEFFISAGLEIPEYSYYEDFPQIENGVGLISMLLNEFHEYLEDITSKKLKVNSLENRKISIATGVSSYKYIKIMAEKLEKVYNVKVNVYAVINDFFGDTVTVTGLLTGKDIVSQLKDRDLGSELLISKAMLKADEDIFLDNYTLDMIEDELKVKIIVVDNSGSDFINKVIGNTLL